MTKPSLFYTEKLFNHVLNNTKIELEGYVRLIVELIRLAVVDGDDRFLRSEGCEHYAELAGINYQALRLAIKRDNRVLYDRLFM